MNATVTGRAPAVCQSRTDRSKAFSTLTTQSSVLLDLLRGLAALIVLVTHWRNFLFQDYPLLPFHTPAINLFYLFTSAGHQAVVIFFVLSGYLISGSIFRMVERGRWSWVTYLLNRLTRLWIVLVPGLLLCLFWDRLGLRLHLAPALYGGAYYNHMTGDVEAGLSPRILLDNIFFLQGVGGRAMLGSDGALWSLANEFWYYLLFPLGLAAFWVSRKPARQVVSASTRLFSAALFLLVALFVRGGILWMFPVWLAGTLLHLAPPLKLSSRTRMLAGLVYLPVFYGLTKWQTLGILWSDGLLTVATLVLVYVLLSATHPARSGLFERSSRQLARFSYTLYVVHMPFVLFVTACVAHDQRWLPTPLHMLEAVGILFLTLAYAFLVASFTEFHTDNTRRWIEDRLRFNRQPRRTPARYAADQI